MEDFKVESTEKDCEGRECVEGAEAVGCMGVGEDGAFKGERVGEGEGTVKVGMFESTRCREFKCSFKEMSG